jgi:hypothetical protein
VLNIMDQGSLGAGYDGFIAHSSMFLDTNKKGHRLILQALHCNHLHLTPLQ